MVFFQYTWCPARRVCCIGHNSFCLLLQHEEYCVVSEPVEKEFPGTDLSPNCRGLPWPFGALYAGPTAGSVTATAGWTASWMSAVSRRRQPTFDEARLSTTRTSILQPNIGKKAIPGLSVAQYDVCMLQASVDAPHRNSVERVL